MPFIENNKPLGPKALAPDQEETGYLDALSPAFEAENTIGSFLTREEGSSPLVDLDSDYDPISAMPEDIPKEYAKSYAFANNQDDVDSITRQVKREIANRQKLANAGWLGVAAGFTAGVLDPINLIPIGGSAYKSYRVGGSILQNGLITARAGLIGASAAEVALHATQETRTWGESAANVAAATFLSGVLGGAVGAVSANSAPARATRRFEDLATRVEEDLTVPKPTEPDPMVPGSLGDETVEISTLNPEGGSAGAAAVENYTTKAQESLANALGVDKVVAFQDPVMRTLTSAALTSRRLIQRVAENPMAMAKNAEGIASDIAVETRVKMHETSLWQGFEGMDDAFVRYRTGRSDMRAARLRIGIKDIISPSDKLTYDDFKTEVARAMRRGDKHDIPEVAEAAKHLRETVFNPLRDQAIAAKLLPEDVGVTTAESYLSRVYNLERMATHKTDFLQVTANWLRGKDEARQEKAETLRRLMEDRKEIIGRVKSHEAKASRAKKAEAALEAREREISGLNQFAYKRSEKMSETLDGLRQEIREITSKASESLSDLEKIRKDIKTEKTKFPDIKEADSRQLRFQMAASRIRKEGNLVEAVEAADEISQSLSELVDTYKRAAQDAADASAEARENPAADHLVKLEDARDHLAKKVRPLRKKLRQLRKEIRAEKSQKGGSARGGAVFETQIRKRGKTVSDQKSGKAHKAAGAVADMERNAEKLKLLMDEIKALTVGSDKKVSNRVIMNEARRIARTPGDAIDEELQDIAEQIWSRIIGTPDGRMPYDVDVSEMRPRKGKSGGAVRGPLKTRSFDIPDELIEDFLENDIEMISRMYVRSMAPDVELTKAFGDVQMTEAIKEVDAEWGRIMNASPEADRSALLKKRDADIRDLAAVRDRVRHTYGLPENPNGLAVRTFRVARSLNYMRLLGGMTLSAFPDAARPVMVHGLGRVFRDGIVPLVRGLGDYSKVKAAAREVKLAGTALDMVLDTRTMSIADIADNFGRRSKFERGIQAATDKFGLVSLMAPWNAAMKQFSGIVTMTRMLDAAAAVTAGKISEKELGKLAQQGISPAMAKRIARQFAAHGETADGVKMANTEAWTDAGAREAFQAGLVKEVDKIIVTPGQDKPLWMSTELGKVIGQFKSFSIASTQRTLIAGLQQRDMATLNGAMLMVGLGMLTYTAKEKLAGRELSEDPAVWLTEGFDRSGLLGWFFEANNMAEKVTRGNIGVSALTGGPQMSRYASRNITGALLGPTVGLTQDFVQTTGSAFSGDWQSQDTRALRRLLPYQNLFYLRSVLDAAEEGVNDALGAPN